mmetsp:Transcript_2233/g.3293  ORF Transcript_2233/g.3293 Transcript_2233/m.3293 type:complete len:260 (-) Transcript_2233:105-884(-)|eukprot:CAMPEP_0116030440 /NCGR_PEP_ID=MMETSP0321-20121206/16858_1 /TAXON_ID=163516 /ORGANISM="Leptocylindrus danicus var. danicus, Strain B650" /LENGTH=259 /DNA_ID=CAMNT_0003505251 /DNA_START=52 /DNA_END=834 /DNA_ORIENTATION=+
MFRRVTSSLTPKSGAPASNRGSAVGTPQSEREQALKDYKLTIEYKHLKEHSPSGVYLIPSHENLRVFYGAIFVRRGPYTNGIFRFKVTLPQQYNDVNTWPLVEFFNQVYSPYVDGETGVMNVKSSYPKWDPTKHYLITLLTHLKKIFYVKSYEDVKLDSGGDAIGNREALECWKTNRAMFRQKVEECVKTSQAEMFVDFDPSNSTLHFNEDALQYQILRQLLSQRSQEENSFLKMSRTEIFDLVGEAGNRAAAASHVSK